MSGLIVGAIFALLASAAVAIILIRLARQDRPPENKSRDP